MNEAQRLRAEGFSVAEIASRLALHRSTVYRHLGEVEPDDDHEPGRVERALLELVSTRKLTDEGRLIAVEAQTLAAKLDALGGQTSAQAGLALAAVSRG